MKVAQRTKRKIRNQFLINLLKERGILNDDSSFLEAFFHPKKTNELPAENLDNIEKGYQLFKKHLEAGRKIYLPVDPDCDGFTSASLFYNYMKDHLQEKYDNEIIYRIPEGKEHGFDSIMNWFPEDGHNSLIVMPDGGSNDVEEHKELYNRGYEILILDHHEVDHFSDCAVVINNQPSSKYSNKQLSGVGVVYKFFEYFEKNENIPNYSQNYLDLVALGMTGDMMEMNNLENRYILT